MVTALHNHWLFEDPRLMYIHFESIDQPLDFARKVAEALCVLGRTRSINNSIDIVKQIAETLSSLKKIKYKSLNYIKALT